MKLDILAIGVHPDDVELSCCGTLINEIALGKKVGILDLTKGELGTRGSAELRLQEAEKARVIMGAAVRENLGYSDGFFINDENHLKGIIKMLRKYQPEIVFANAVDDRHPDHGRAAKLIADACFLSGLIKIETVDEEGKLQAPWRPRHVFHYVQDRYLHPSFVLDITASMNKKMESIMAYSSQFFDPNSNEPATYISSPHFMDGVKARALSYGKMINVEYAEGFVSPNPVGVKSIFDLT